MRILRANWAGNLSMCVSSDLRQQIFSTNIYFSMNSHNWSQAKQGTSSLALHHLKYARIMIREHDFLLELTDLNQINHQ